MVTSETNGWGRILLAVQARNYAVVVNAADSTQLPDVLTAVVADVRSHSKCCNLAESQAIYQAIRDFIGQWAFESSIPHLLAVLDNDDTVIVTVTESFKGETREQLGDSYEQHGANYQPVVIWDTVRVTQTYAVCIERRSPIADGAMLALRNLLNEHPHWNEIIADKIKRCERKWPVTHQTVKTYQEVIEEGWRH
jgi:hypothetical protein